MQYQICECGEQIPPNELGTKLLTHWQHQHQTCLYSYIGCVSVSVLKSTVYVYGRTSLKLDLKVKKGLPREYRRCVRLSSKLLEWLLVAPKHTSNGPYYLKIYAPVMKWMRTSWHASHIWSEVALIDEFNFSKNGRDWIWVLLGVLCFYV